MHANRVHKSASTGILGSFHSDWLHPSSPPSISQKSASRLHGQLPFWLAPPSLLPHPFFFLYPKNQPLDSMGNPWQLPFWLAPPFLFPLYILPPPSTHPPTSPILLPYIYPNLCSSPSSKNSILRVYWCCHQLQMHTIQLVPQLDTPQVTLLAHN